jgi:hypothetical protein
LISLIFQKENGVEGSLDDKTPQIKVELKTIY